MAAGSLGPGYVYEYDWEDPPLDIAERIPDDEEVLIAWHANKIDE